MQYTPPSLLQSAKKDYWTIIQGISTAFKPTVFGLHHETLVIIPLSGLNQLNNFTWLSTTLFFKGAGTLFEHEKPAKQATVARAC